MMTDNTKEIIFQKRTGFRSNNGGLDLFKKALLGCRRSYKNSDNSP